MDQLYEFLKEDTPIEQMQKRTASFIPDYPDLELTSPSKPPVLKDQFFFKNKDVYISKHNRFAPYPEHAHQFLEFNYQLKGSSRQLINGHPYVLEEGDILLMDSGSRHSIEPLGEDDLLINILFSDQMISLNWLEQMHAKDSILYRVLLTADMAESTTRNFLIFRTNASPHIKETLYRMMTEYFFPRTFSSTIISHYLSILLYELARQLPIEQDNSHTEDEPSPLVRTLALIDTEYQSITLQKAAKRLNFNKNYLSNMIKQKSGDTFTGLVTKKRLMKAKLLLQTTELPISSIHQMVGISNKTFFYKKFKEEYGQLPSEIRTLNTTN